MVVNDDKIGFLSSRQDIWWKSAACYCVSREVGKNNTIVFDGFGQHIDNMSENTIVTPGISALLERHRAIVQNMEEGLSIMT